MTASGTHSMGGKSPSSAECVGKLKVLADATRLAVIELLMQGPLRVGELNARLQLDQSLLSHHLRVLREAGLVQAARDGKAVIYSLVPSIETTESAPGINLGCCRITFD